MSLTAALATLGRPVGYYPRVTKWLGGDVSAAVFVCQFIYWRGKVGNREIYKSRDEIEEETGLSHGVQKRISNRLKQLGYVQVVKKGLPARNYYKFDWDKMDADFATWGANQCGGINRTSTVESAAPDRPDQPDQTGRNCLTTSETTTETTTETTDKSKPDKPVCDTAVSLARLLYTEHLKTDEGYMAGKSETERERAFVKWSRDIEKIMRIDKRTEADIRSVIRWCQQPGGFWAANILSGNKLRQKFPTLYAQMNRDSKWRPQPTHQPKDDPLERYLRGEITHAEFAEMEGK